MKTYVIVGLLLGALVLYGCSTSKILTTTEIAKCLTSKGATMYGSSWCPACKKQKELFGDDFKHIKYVECSEPNEGCKKIRYLPTWELPDGALEVGAKKPLELANLMGCK